jgi:hypothetical protein
MRTHRLLMTLLVDSLLASQGVLARQGGVYDRLPVATDVRARYVIYLHGRIIEDRGRRPTHATWGTYEYQQILDRLAADGLVVVSEHRPPMTDMDMFAIHVADQVRALACGDGDFSGSSLKVWGRVLSVYEASDDVGRSCQSLFAKSGATGQRSEVRIAIGEEHGAFFRPHREWLEPVLKWVRNTAH